MNLFKLLLSLGKTLRETEHSDIKINITKKDGKYTVTRIYSNQNATVGNDGLAINRPDGSIWMQNEKLNKRYFLCQKTGVRSI